MLYFPADYLICSFKKEVLVMRKTKTGRVAAAKVRLKRATRLAEIVMDALDQFPPAQRAAKLREYKLFLAKGLKSFPS